MVVWIQCSLFFYNYQLGFIVTSDSDTKKIHLWGLERWLSGKARYFFSSQYPQQVAHNGL